MLEALNAPDFDAIICCEPDWSRAVPAADIAAAAGSMGLSAELITNPVEALYRAIAVTAADDLILVAGSLYVVGEVRAAALALQANRASSEADPDEPDDGEYG